MAMKTVNDLIEELHKLNNRQKNLILGIVQFNKQLEMVLN